MGYFGCKKCILEKRKYPAKIQMSGDATLFKGSGCTIQCIHHNTPMEWIDEDVDEKINNGIIFKV